jgi:hypothetical protein
MIINCISIAISLEGAEVMDWAKPFGRGVQPKPLIDRNHNLRWKRDQFSIQDEVRIFKCTEN